MRGDGQHKNSAGGRYGEKRNIDFAAGNFWKKCEVADGGTLTIKYRYLPTSNTQMGSRLSPPANERAAISIGAREVNTERSPNEAQATSRVIRVAGEQFINMKARDRSTGARAANSADDKIRAHDRVTHR